MPPSTRRDPGSLLLWLGTLVVLVGFPMNYKMVSEYLPTDDWMEPSREATAVPPASLRSPTAGPPKRTTTATTTTLPILPIAPATNNHLSSSSCCYRTETDFSKLFTPEYFEEQARLSTRPYSGTELDEWQEFAAETPLGKAVAVPPSAADADAAGESVCEIEWRRVVLESSEGFYLKAYLAALQGWGPDELRYVPPVADQPRILLLGDSISQGITVETQNMFGKFAVLQGSPVNTQGIDAYHNHLDDWIGACPWDLVQFNVGQHFHPDPAAASPEEALAPYEETIRKTIRRLKEHSPHAVIVVAATTPSPLDVDATKPDPSTCPHYDKFHPGGFVPGLNELAKQVASDEGAIWNDRFASVAPRLDELQMPCDIHFSLEGYRKLAQSDWAVFTAALESLDPPPVTSCCFHTAADRDHLSARFTPAYFDASSSSSSSSWNGTEHADWTRFTKDTAQGRALANLSPGVPDECELQWNQLVLDQTDGYFWREYLSGLLRDGSSDRGEGYPNPRGFPYVASRPGIPRILLLGDSVSQGIWQEVIAYFNAHANIHTAPTDCGGFDRYRRHLDTWLGDCPYHMIHFNVGWHHGDAGLDAYEAGLRFVVQRLREHSPAAQIVFATTTPSPLDLDPAPSCGKEANHPPASLAPFPPPGRVAEINDVAKRVAKELSVVLNDRYAAVLPRLSELQKPCDVHFTLEGNQLLATSDWTVIGGYLGLL